MDTSQAGAAVAAVGAMRYGSHCCFVSDEDDITRLAVSGYVRDGLAADDRILCVLGLRDRAWLVDALVAARTPVERHVADGSLVIVEMRQGALWQGDFSSSDSAQVMFDAIDGALADGYKGLRVYSDMSWGLVHSVPHPALVEMERLLEEGLRGLPGMGLCVYDPREFTLAEIDERSHHHSLVSGPGRVQAPSLQILETARGLRLIGEADLTVRNLLDTALQKAASHAPPGTDIVVDLSSLVFADASAIEALFLAGSQLGPGCCLVVRSPTPTVRKVLTILGWDGMSGMRVDTDPASGGAP
jgi:anti-anti-sigma regulatory factor